MAQKMILEFPCKLEHRDELVGMMNGGMLDETRAYEGCVGVSIYTAEGNDSSVYLFEEWETQAHQQKYFGWRVETGALETLGPMLQGEPKVTWLVEHT